MKKYKDVNNQTHEIKEGFEHKLPEGCIEIDQAEFDILTTPVPLTTKQINDEKDARARNIVDSPLGQAMAEEFADILTAANIPVPADLMANVKERVKGKL